METAMAAGRMSPGAGEAHPRLTPIAWSWNPLHWIALAGYSASKRFSDRDRAALRYVEEINTVRQVTDETFAGVRQHFSEREIVELTWLNAVGNYLNLQARPLGLAPDETCAIPSRT